MLIAICRTTVALMFLLSSSSKLRDFKSFADTVERFHILPNRIVRPSSIAIIISEIVAAITLFIDNYYTAGFFLSICLLLIFSFAILSALINKIETSCNCFGTSQSIISSSDLIRNSIIIVMALIGLISTKPISLSQLHLADIAVSTLISLVFTLALTNFSDIVHLF
jgi:hypothetical protein